MINSLKIIDVLEENERLLWIFDQNFRYIDYRGESFEEIEEEIEREIEKDIENEY